MARFVACIAAIVALTAPTTAHAFDTAPHFDITGDALAADGFGRDAIRVVQVNNWFNDLYVNAKAVPQSGHAPWWKVLIGARWYLGEVESWPDEVVAAGTAMHFDSNNGGFGYKRKGDLELEWNRLLDQTIRMCQGARPKEPLSCLTVLGASLHKLQDFYAHTNWVEPRFTDDDGYDGPGWDEQGKGSTPTWFDLTTGQRNSPSARVYTNGPPSGKIDRSDRLFNRGHGSWRSDKNKNLATAMNKDWPGRPRYAEAYIAAYFATRQWVDIVRRGINDDEFWDAMRSYQPPNAKARADLQHDLRKGARGMSYWTGHWQGQGEPALADDPGPGGSLDDVFFDSRAYFARDRTIYRNLYQSLIPTLAMFPKPPLQGYKVPSTRPLQERTRFVRVQITRMKSHGAGDIGPDDADFYAEGVVDGQEFLSGFIHGYDSFSFKRPNAPFTFIKAVNVGDKRPESLTELRVTVRTANVDGAGTDDDVYLRVSDKLRFKLNKPTFDDFERGSTTTYSLPVDTTTPFDTGSKGYTLADIDYIQLEKSKDGGSGAWKLGGVSVWANGRVLYGNGGIEQWLRKNDRTWRAPDFTSPGNALSAEIAVWLSLYDADSFLYGGDDHADINPDYLRRNVGINYELGTVAEGTVRGGSRYTTQVPKAPCRSSMETRQRFVTRSTRST